MRFLDAAATRSALPMVDAIRAMRLAFVRDREIPQRQSLGSSLFMPGRVGDTSGIKVVSTQPGSPLGIVAVFDATGAPVGLVDGPTLTAIRTGAVAGLATDLLADTSSSSLALLGAGAMAADQVAAVRAVRSLTEVYVWSRNPARAAALADQVGAVALRDADDAVARADIVSTATPATSPLFADSALRERVHINAVGAYTPQMVEIPSTTVTSAFVVVDDREAARHEAGDLIQADRIPDMDLTELLEGGLGDRPARTLFKSVGIASQDIAAAAVAIENAQRLGIGVVVD